MPNPPPLIVSHPSKVPGHGMYGDWALPGRQYSYIALLDFARKYMPGKQAELIAFKEICAKPGDWFGGDDFSGPRFDAADIQYPGMLIRSMPNPCELPYRMVDGRRRMEKLKRRGLKAGPFFIFDYADCEEFIFDFELQSD